MCLSRKSRIHVQKCKGAASDQDEHEEDTGPPSKSRKVDGHYDGQPVNSDIIFRPPEKGTQRWNVQEVVSGHALKYSNSVLDEESFKDISKDIGKPANELLALPLLSDVIKKADQVIINKGLIQGDNILFRCQDHLIAGVFPLLEL